MIAELICKGCAHYAPNGTAPCEIWLGPPEDNECGDYVEKSELYHVSEAEISCSIELAELRRRLAAEHERAETAVTACAALREFLRAIEGWEAALLNSDSSWATVDGLPRMTQVLYDSWMDLQRRRNKLLSAPDPGRDLLADARRVTTALLKLLDGDCDLDCEARCSQCPPIAAALTRARARGWDSPQKDGGDG